MSKSCIFLTEIRAKYEVISRFLVPKTHEILIEIRGRNQNAFIKCLSRENAQTLFHADHAHCRDSVLQSTGSGQHTQNTPPISTKIRGRNQNAFIKCLSRENAQTLFHAYQAHCRNSVLQSTGSGQHTQNTSSMSFKIRGNQNAFVKCLSREHTDSVPC